MLEKIVEYMGELYDEELYEEVKAAIDAGHTKMEILDALQQGMTIVGQRFAAKEYYVAELIFSAEIFEECSKMFGQEEEGEPKYGTFVIGTVYTDLHDIGKNITAQLFKCNGFRVVDLGVDVAPEAFLQAIREYDPTVVGLSCLLTTSFDPTKDIIAQIRGAGLDQGRFVYVGGAPVDANACRYVDADDYFNDAQESLRKAIAFVEAHR